MAILPLLYRVQEIESRLAQLEQTLLQLQEDPSLTALEGLKTELDQIIIKAEKQLEQQKRRQRQLSLELNSCEERLKQENEKLYSGTIVQPRELELVQQKVAEYQGLCSKLEEDLLQLMECDEVKTAELTGTKQRRAAVAAEYDQRQNELYQQKLAVNFEKEQLQLELEELLPQIPLEWLEKYRRIAKAHRGIGITRIKQQSCGACHVSLAESRLQQIKRGEDKLYCCENCGRILYYS
ncbi:MAG TPA: C4-type zinc ribbon domain-containing protein [Bacillota bacterium]